MTPRATRLVRVPDLRAMHAAIARGLARPIDRPHQAILVPTRGASEELRRTLETMTLSAGATALAPPDILTRAEFYSRLYDRLPDAPARLSEFEREVMLRRAARDTAARGLDAPFRLRPGLVVEILGFYDELRRRDQTLDDFERLMVAALEPSADTDRGAERMLRQTHVLAAALAEFERRVNATGSVDEHGLRTLLLSRACRPAYRHVVVTLADRASDAHGLWPADFDLLARMPGVDRLDVIATERLLAAGFHERIHAALPEIEEERSGARGPLPVLAVPERHPSEERSGAPGPPRATSLAGCRGPRHPNSEERSGAEGPPRATSLAGCRGPRHPNEEGTRWFVCRDREEELVFIARGIVCGGAPSADDTAVVFQRPLPYLYLARQVFAGANLPYHALDSLPLAVEPFVAALDLVFTFALAEGSRASLVALLRSPHWSFEDDGRPVGSGEVEAADALLQQLKYHGGFERLSQIAADAGERADVEGGRRRRIGLWARAAGALRGALEAARELQALANAGSASAQIRALVAFVRGHERLPTPSDPWHARHLRARAAVLAALESLGEAHERHDDQPLSVAELSASTRRWIEGQTFAPRTGSGGVRLLDAAAAMYADVRDLRLVGLVDADWPERGPRNIFYPASLLAQLGWPAESARLAAARARFQDLLTLPSARLSLHTFTLEEDAIVPASTFLEDVEAAGLPIERVPPLPDVRVFAHEALAEDPVAPEAAGPEAAAWLALRTSRTPPTDASFRGTTGGWSQPTFAVSHVERYLECPFKYFAAHVLRLPEEREDESGLTPQEQGQFLHEVFQEFFSVWHASGRRAVTTANVSDALALFERVTDEQLLSLAEADRALARTHLLGSAVAPGLAERAFAFELEQGGEVLDRLLEFELEGRFEFKAAGVTRAIALRAKADRIDLMADGTLRVIDYKLSRAPKQARALQLPIYGVCAEQHLRGQHGRDWTLGCAGYIAFKEKNPFVPLGRGSLSEAVADGQARFLDTVAAIESGAFPVNPEEPYRCQWCAYPTVCRKDYVGDE